MDGIDGLTAGDPVTAEQMRALFGCGLHPLAELRQQQEGPDPIPPDPIPRDLQEPTQLGVPFTVVDGDVSAFKQKSDFKSPKASSIMTKGRLTRASNSGAKGTRTRPDLLVAKERSFTASAARIGDEVIATDAVLHQARH